MSDFEVKLTLIIPIYNVEKFLRSCLDSVVEQTMDKNELEVLLINDGSPDNSIAIMEEYAAKYPYMKTFVKENEGLSRTRNFGIRHAHGKYIMYLDSDDTLTPETLKEVTDFFDAHYNEVDLVTYKIIPVIDGKYGNPHYRYDHLTVSGVYDLNDFENAFICQTNINICVKNLREDNIFFDTTPNFRHEDQKYCTQILQRKMKIGFCDKGLYNYLNQPDSIVRTYFYAYYIFETTMQFWEDLFGEYQDKVPPYIQGLFVNDIEWKTRSNILLPYHYNEEDFANAKNRIANLLSRVDDRTILCHPKINNFHKPYFIQLRNGNDINVIYGDERIAVTNHGKVIYTMNSFEMTLLEFKPRKDHVSVIGQIKSPLCNYIEKPELLMIINNDYSNPKPLDLRLSSYSYYNTKELTNHFWLYQFDIPIPDTKSIELRVKVNPVLYKSEFYFLNRVAFEASRTICRGDMKYTVKGSKLLFEKMTAKEANDELTKIKHKYKAGRKKRWLYRNHVLRMKASGDRIWLYHDCKGVLKDNGYYQFSYDLKQNDGVKRYFIVNEENFSEVKKQFPQSERSHLVQFGSRRHKDLFLCAEKIITAFIERENYHPFSARQMKNYYDISDEPDLYYLQHGVLHAHVPWKYSLDRVLVRKEIISTRFEQENMINNYRFDENHLLTCGMPRYDFIDDKQEPGNRILFAPSWRNYLVKRRDGNWIANENGFLTSDFYKETSEFLNSKELRKILEDHDMYLDFKLHPILKFYQHLYKIDNPRVTLADNKVSETEYKVFMTDFSSYVFDFVYLQRPIIYFLPDEELFRSGMNDYREVDIPLDKGFGDYVTSAKDAVAALQRIADNQFGVADQYKEKMETMFFHKDNKQRERIYDAIIHD